MGGGIVLWWEKAVSLSEACWSKFCSSPRDVVRQAGPIICRDLESHHLGCMDRDGGKVCVLLHCAMGQRQSCHSQPPGRTQSGVTGPY